MKNSVESLFDSVLSSLSPDQDLDWQNEHVDESDFDALDRPVDSSDEGLITIDEEQIGGDGLDRLAGRRVFGELNSPENDSFEGGVRVRGFDALAFYKSRRLISARPFVDKWGIFYLKEGLIFVESHISRAYPGYSDPRKLAIEFLRQHEQFHYRADVQTLLFEATLGKHLYLPLRRALRGMRSHFVEEALANRQVWDWSKKKSVGLEEFAYDFMMLQPHAYARFDESRRNLTAEWAGTVVDQKKPGTNLRRDLSHWVEATPSGFLRNSLCPEYVVYPRSLSRWVSPALVPPPVNYVQDGENVIKILKGRFAHLQSRWEHTKSKLLENRLLHGLNFKPWPKDGPRSYSVRVDDNFRAHLRHEGAGQWVAYILGPHKKLGHG